MHTTKLNGESTGEQSNGENKACLMKCRVYEQALRQQQSQYIYTSPVHWSTTAESYIYYVQ